MNIQEILEKHDAWLNGKAGGEQANLREANLREAIDAPIVMHVGPWDVYIQDIYMQIGCEKHSFEQWSSFTDEEIKKMDDRALEFWKRNREFLLAACEASREAGGAE